MPKQISEIVTVGNPSSASFRTSQASTLASGASRKVSETKLVSTKIKDPVLARSAGFPV
jgi:hypothetical protein